MSNPNEFDLIIVGAGTSGALLPAAYLSKAGARVAIIEAKTEAGTGQMTHELIPNAMSTPSGAICLFTNTPAWEDLELEEKYGLKILVGQGPVGALFDDGKCLQFFYDLDRTHDAFARFSKKDADKTREIMGRILQNYGEFNDVVYFAEPAPERLERVWGISAEMWGIPVDQFRDMNMFELLDTTFENDYVKSCWAGTACTQVFGDVAAKGLGAFAVAAYQPLGFPSMIEGGNHGLVHTLLRVFQDNGGTILRNCPVEKIIVEDNKATGVRLSETAVYPEKIIHAKHGVLSNVGARLTLQLVGEEIMKKADLALALKMKYWEMGSRASSVHYWAIKGLPQWEALKWDPNYKNCHFMYKVPSKFDDLKRWSISSKCNDAWAAFGNYGEICIPTAIDPLQISPEGFHVFRIEEVLPFNGFRRQGFGPEYWDVVKDEMMRKRTEQFERLIPGFKDKLIDEMYLTPLDIWRYNPSWIEGNAVGGGQSADQWYLGRMPYRMPIRGLYMSAGNWPFALSHCLIGYIAACAIAEDMGIRKQPWWTHRPVEWFVKNLGRFMVKYE